MSDSHDDIPVDDNKRKDGSKSKKEKKDKKDKGYMIFEEEDSAEELFESVQKIPSKSKKTKPFKFAKKEKKERSDKKKDEKEKKQDEKEKKQDEKEKKQDEKEKKSNKESKKLEKTKWKKKILSKSGESDAATEPDEQKIVFGVPLALAVERNPSHDGILLPAVVRGCIDYISEYGLACEGIYRVSGVKSKVTQLKEAYNSGTTVYLVDHEPNVVASLLKLFLRELPEPVLTTKLVPKFEQASATKNVKQKVEQFCSLIQELPDANRTLLSWVIVHMTQVIEKEKYNKMSLQNVSIVLSPTMKISHRVLNVLFTYSTIFFKDTIIKKYVPPLRPATSKWALDLPECPTAIEEELKKQESLLNHMHGELMKVKDHLKEEELWEVQRIVTQLKRKLKHLHQMEQATTKTEVSLDKKQSFSSQKSWSHVHHDSKISLSSSNADLSKVQDKTDQLSLSGDQTRAEVGVKLRSKDHLRSSDKKHHTPEVLSRKKMLQGEAKRHSSSASERNSKLDKSDNRGSFERGDGSLRTSIEKETTCHHPIALDKVIDDDVSVAEERQETEENAAEGNVSSPSSIKKSRESVKLEENSEVVEHERIGETNESEDQKIESTRDVGEEIVVGVEIVDEQGTSVDGLIYHESEKTQPMKIEPVENSIVSESNRTTLPYIEDDASDSSDPYTDVAEDDDDDDDDDSEKKSSSKGRGGENDDNDYEVLGDDESPSPQCSSQPKGMQGSFASVTNTEQDSPSVTSEEESSDDELANQAEMFDKLLEEFNRVMMEEEELLAIGNELRQKIDTERNEIERLQQDISELQMMRHDDSSDTSSSSSSSSSDSSGSLDDDLTNEELRDLLIKHQQENAKLEQDNALMCEKIHLEKMACLEVKVQNRMIQQKQLDANVDLIDFE